MNQYLVGEVHLAPVNHGTKCGVGQSMAGVPDYCFLFGSALAAQRPEYLLYSSLAMKILRVCTIDPQNPTDTSPTI